MNTKTRSATRDLVLAALFLALAFVLPMITGHVPQIGNMLCPMHFPVLLAGFVLGGPWGLALGFAAPLLRSVLFGMPPMYPIAIARPPCLGCGALCAGRSVRLQFSVQRVPVRCGAHCRARYRGAAHPHSADRGCTAESKADGLNPLR